MAMTTGVYVLKNVPVGYTWKVYAPGSKNIRYEWYKGDEKILSRTTSTSCYYPTPRLIPSEDNPNNLFLFYGNNTNKGRVLVNRLTYDTNAQTVNDTGYNYCYFYDGDDTKTLMYYRAVSVNAAPGGVLMTHSSSKYSEMYLSFIATENLDGFDKEVVADRTWNLNIDKATIGVDFIFQCSAIVPSQEDGAMRLVVAFLDKGAGVFKIIEYALDGDFCPTRATEEPLEIAVTDTIQSNYAFMHTGMDGRAWLSFYTGTSAEPVASTFCRDVEVSPIGDGQYEATVDWKYEQLSDLPDVSEIIYYTEPSISYYANAAGDAAAPSSLSEDGLTELKVPIYRLVNRSANPNIISSESDHFGDALRVPLQKILYSSLPPVLLGVVEGTPPLSNGVLLEQGDQAANSFSEISIISSKSGFASTKVSESFGFMVRVAAWAGAEAGIMGVAKGGVTRTVEFSANYLYASSFERFERQTQVVSIKPKGKPRQVEDGSYEQLRIGTAYVLQASVIGYMYYFQPLGVTDFDSLPPGIPVLYEYGTTDVEIIPYAYDINPKDPQPGILKGYQDVEYLNELNELPALHFQEDGFPVAKPQMSWTSAFDNEVKITAEFEESRQNRSANAVDLKASITQAWNGEIGVGGATLKAGAEFGFQVAYSYGVEKVDGDSAMSQISADMDMDGFPNNEESLQRYTTLIYFIKAEDESAQSREITDTWVEKLREPQTRNNQVLHDLLWSEGDPDHGIPAHSRIPHSNPWFIRYGVKNVDPPNYDGDPMEPMKNQRVRSEAED